MGPTRGNTRPQFFKSRVACQKESLKYAREAVVDIESDEDLEPHMEATYLQPTIEVERGPVSSARVEWRDRLYMAFHVVATLFVHAAAYTCKGW